MPHKILTSVGLSPKEAEIYETALRSGECSIVSIVKRLRTHPQIIYRAIESLQKRGLIQSVIRGSKRFVRAEDPRTLIKHEEKKLKEVKKAVSDLLTLSIAKERDDALIKVSSGNEAVRNVRARAIDLLATTREPLFIIGGSGDRFFEAVGEDWYEEIEIERIEQKIRKRLVTFESQRATLQQDRFREFCEYRYLPEAYPIPASTNIVHDTVAIFVWSADPSVITIKSREVAESYQSYFESLWKIAKP